MQHSKNPRVLIVGNFLSTHGLSRGVCEELAPRLQSSGWTVYTTSSKLSKPARLVDMVTSAWRLRKHFDVAQVDVYSGRAFYWSEAVCGVLRHIQKPYVLTLHGGGLPEFARSNEARVRRLLNSAAAITAPSRYLQEKMSRYVSGAMVLPNGLQLSNYRWRERRALEPKLLWLRAFHEIYNPSMAVRVMARLKERVPGLRLAMVGADKGDSSKQRAEAAAQQLRVSDVVEMRNPVPKESVPQVMDAADVFINTSSIDNTPVSVLEAMASGLCVVSTDVGGMPYLVRAGETALLVPSNDDAAMALAIERLLKDQALARNVRQAARTQVERFDWPAVLAQWQQLFRSVEQGALYLRTA